MAELTTDLDADQGPVGLPTRKGATRTLPPSFPSARSSRALDGDDDTVEHDDEPDAEELFWRRVDDEYQRWKEEGRR